MKYSRTCECCGSVVTAYTHKLNKWLVSWLRQLVDHYEIHKSWANLREDLKLSITQYTNMQKLQYFKLAYRDSNGRVPTQKWSNFVYWLSPCENTSATLGKSILPPDHEARATHKAPVKMMYIHDVDETQYKRREEYAQEKTPQKSLFF